MQDCLQQWIQILLLLDSINTGLDFRIDFEPLPATKHKLVASLRRKGSTSVSTAPAGRLHLGISRGERQPDSWRGRA